MNISLSYNWLKEYVKTNKSAREFAKVFSLHSMTIDRIHESEQKWKNVITVKILSIEKHPNADKLRLATVDTGKEKIKVVCGAPNIEAGHIVPLVKEGGEVMGPDGKNFIVKKANIRGVDSPGMLCSKRELGLGDDHTGIFILPKETKIGEPLEKVLPSGDAVFEIEVTSNRPDAMSAIGLAREAAAIFKTKFLYKEPKHDIKVPKDADAKKYNLSIRVSEKTLCPRYQAVVMAGVRVEPSPLWMQSRLMQSGIRPINNVVDITNYVLLEYGQPMHVFDYEKLQGVEIIVRRAKDGEKILALDGNAYSLGNDNLVIADAKAPVAIAGVMGGEMSAVKETTKIIVFEAANFNPISVRKTSRKLRLISESSNLFEKGLSPEGTAPALLRAIELTQKVAHGQVVSKIFDTYKKEDARKVVKVRMQEIESYLGITMKSTEVKKSLELLGFGVAGGLSLTVLVPWWRKNDVAMPEDIIEEVARIYGYHKLPISLPTGEIPKHSNDTVTVWADLYKDVLQGVGFTEIYSYSMVSKRVLERLYINPDSCLKIANPLNEDLEYMRPTLLPGILEAMAFNQENFEKIKIFELSRVYLPKGKDLPDESLRLFVALSGGEDLFSRIKGVAELLLKKFGVSETKYISKPTEGKSVWRKGICQDMIRADKTIGRIGFIDKGILHSFGIKKDMAVLDLDFSHLALVSSTMKKYTPPPAYPQIIRDLALVVIPDLSWKDLEDYISRFHVLIQRVDYLSTYTGKELEGKKSVALRLIFQSDKRTLKSGEVDDIIKQLVVQLEQKFGAKLR